MNLTQMLIVLAVGSGIVLAYDKFGGGAERRGADDPPSALLSYSLLLFPISVAVLAIRYFEIGLALVLVLLTALSGVVILVDKIRRRGETDEAPAPGTLVDYSRSFFPVLLFVLIIRSFVFEPFRIPSGSMMPTLLQGDFIFVKKYSYGLRIPVIESKIVETGAPERGDVVVFRLPSNPKINYIKRVIGLPGDLIEYRGHQLTINGVAMPLERDADNPRQAEGARWIESLDGREHQILIRSPGYAKGEGVYRVPEGEYFMMGDNRDNSEDSRFIDPVAEEFLVGEAVRVWMHMDGIEWPDWSRIGMKIE